MRTLKYIVSVGVGLAVMAFVSVSCGNNQSTAEKVEQASEEVADAFRTEREELMADLKEARKDINSQFAALEKDLENASDDAKLELRKQMSDLEAWGKKVDQQMDDLGKDLSNGWEAFKSDVQTTLKEIDENLEESFNG